MNRTLALAAMAAGPGFSVLTVAHADAVSHIQARGSPVVGA